MARSLLSLIRLIARAILRKIPLSPHIRGALLRDLDPYWFARSGLSTNAAKLRDEGVVVIPDFLPPEECDRLADSARNVVNAISPQEFAAGTGQDVARLPAGTEVMIRRGTSAHMNPNTDVGLIHVRHVDKVVSEFSKLRDAKLPQRIMGEVTHKTITPLYCDIYINQSVTSTRVYHYDSPYLFKSLLYLTDVPSEDEGPYSYLKGTHRFAIHRYKFMIRNLVRGYHLTEMGTPSSTRTLNVFGTKGTLIISDQFGFHRGLPQKLGRSRIVCTVYYAIQ